jgi:hypothetical protein
MASITGLSKLGTDMGLSGTDLRDFVVEQQKLARDERAAERECGFKKRELNQHAEFREKERGVKEKECAVKERESWNSRNLIVSLRRKS